MKPVNNKRAAIRHVKYAVKWFKDARTLLKNRKLPVSEKAIALG